MTQHRPIWFLIFLIFLLVFTGVYLYGISIIPFHPDESTQLFTSGDVEIFWRQPSEIFWQPEKTLDLRQHYRELDAPLTRNLIAISRWLAGETYLKVDWDWGKTWQENVQAGAMPSQRLLLAGRLALAFLFPLSILFFYLTVRKISGEFTAWVAVLLLASNSLVLLHTRRAMAEGPLLFGVTLTLWSLASWTKHRWLTSLPTALAFSAKQTLLPLFPVGLMAVLWPVDGRKIRFWPNLLSQIFAFITLSVLVIFLLHPYLWEHPVQAAKAAVEARYNLARKQISDRPGQSLDTPTRKLVAMIANLYFSPPMFSETANYLSETAASEATYLVNPLHSLFRSTTGASVIMLLNILGFIVSLYKSIKEKGLIQYRLLLMILTNIFLGITIFITVPLPWQRYYIPLVPFVCLWTAVGLNSIIQTVRQLFKSY